ncbi:MAG: 5-oxoprolinase subunit PxpA [Dokdonella sp.]
MRPHGRIDFNCDLGEGCGNDAAIIPLISSANIACGAHAGDTASMRATLRLCREHGVAAGAHPGYVDREHFGRHDLALEKSEITKLIRSQLATIAAIAKEEDIALVHVKPHGALYNQAARDPLLADAIADAVRAFNQSLILIGLAGSELPRAGERAGLRVAHEAFADRLDRADGSLVPRSQANAVIDSVDDAVAQALAIAQGQPIIAADGALIELHADTICLHGDGADAVAFARHLRATFATANVRVQGLDLHAAADS